MSDNNLPNVYYGPPGDVLDWRKEKLHHSEDDDESHPISKSTRLLLRGDPRDLFPPEHELNVPEESSIIKQAEAGRRQRRRAFFPK